MKKYKQIPSEDNKNLEPKNKEELIKRVENKLLFLKNNNLNYIYSMLNNALQWLRRVPEDYIYTTDNYFLQLGVYQKEQEEIYSILLCESDKNLIIQKDVIVCSSDNNEDLDLKTKIYN